MGAGRDREQLDLLDWQPPAIVQRFDEARVRGATLRARIARAVSEVLSDSSMNRAEVAAEMAAYLGERVTKGQLNCYASTARTDNAISFVRLIALARVTNDVRPLQLAAEVLGHAVIETRWLAAVEDAQWADRAEEAKSKQKAARRKWKGGAK